MRLLEYTRISTTAQDAHLKLDAHFSVGGAKNGMFVPTSPAAVNRPPVDPVCRNFWITVSPGIQSRCGASTDSDGP